VFQGHTDLDRDVLDPGWYTFKGIVSTTASTAVDAGTERIQYHSWLGHSLHDFNGCWLRLTIISINQHARYLVYNAETF